MFHLLAYAFLAQSVKLSIANCKHHIFVFQSGEVTTEDTVRVLLGYYSNDIGANYFGTTKVIHIRNLFDRLPERLHLDSVMKFIGHNTVLLNNAVIGRDNIKRRLAKEFVFLDNSFRLTKVDIELGEYLKAEGFHVIEIDESKMIKFSDTLLIDVLWLGDSVLTSTQEMCRIINENEYPGNVFVVKEIDWQNIFNGCLFIPPIVSAKISPNATKNIEVLSTLWQTSKNQNSTQSTSRILLISPIGFCSNSMITDNFFMKTQIKSPREVETLALEEFSRFHNLLVSNGIEVVLFSNERYYNAPDAVFPNNWFSTHHAETCATESHPPTVVVYPMKTESRRAERREHIISELQKVYSQVVSLTHYEQAPLGGMFLEGTGSLVLDRVHRKAYCALSQRTHLRVAKIWCEKMKYHLFPFHAVDDQKRVVYHTNIVMSICSYVAIVCLDAIVDPIERSLIEDNLSLDREVIVITLDQMNHYCGNVLETKNNEGNLLLVMSTEAYNHFNESQKAILRKYFHNVLHTPIPTIEEVGGGSVRCMMAELY